MGATAARAGVVYLTDEGTSSADGTLYRYDTQSNVVTSIATGLSEPRDLAYDPYHDTIYILGRQTVYQYDFGTNTMSSQSVPDLGNPTRFTYDYNDNTIYVQDADDGIVYRYQYDTNNIQPVSSTPTDPPGNLTRFTYDGLDRRVYMTEAAPAPPTTVYQYDPVGSTLGNQSISGLSDVSDISSGGNGNLYLSSEGTVYRYDYNALGPLTPVTTLPASQLISRFTYDTQFNQLRMITEPGAGGVVTYYQYDFGTQSLTGQQLQAPPGTEFHLSAIITRNPVPEPSTFVVLAFGAALMLGFSRSPLRSRCD
jgi:YD repeat-containing protein